ncbi:kinesin-like protein KIF14 isoform X3 [Copidosoma floridanum]|uniref:kinesin-like protein KIF14 isoform X3 n=1 Tax=Copidosoma floridanum TaxID=29053 RepID=UPI0006C983DE|nr:kinesin-like protein KIF14 isoform X3 [Copidosoma floridanum]
MSQGNAEQTPARQRGFCNAIFSSSPYNFNKENKPCNTPNSTSNAKSNTNLGSPSRKRTLVHNLPQNNKPKEQSATRNVTQNLSKTPKKMFRNLPRSQSEDVLQDKTPTKNERLKVNKNGSNPRLSGEKIPVTHFCTPKNVSSTKSCTNSARKPMKRFLSDNVLPQTPDCYNSVHLETPKAKFENGIEEQTVCEGENSNLNVGIRVRPLNYKEQAEPKITSIVEVNCQNIIVDCDTSKHTFMYDHCFFSNNDSSKPGHASQETVFNSIGLPLVQNAFEGYNVCLFAYGQTGSGKSYSMMGPEPSQPNSIDIHPDAGIIPRFCHEIFQRISLDHKNNITVEISYFEIYNEKIHDLLISNNNNGNKRAPLKVREHPVFGPYIVDLSQHSVQSYEDLKTWLKVGNSQRATAATGMNEKSSRSHSIFSIILTQTTSKGLSTSKIEDAGKRSKINLVDLAGSERLSNTCASGDRLREGVSINKSLLTLGKVIGSLAESTNDKKRNFVPYRESVLTWLLKESLGGNSRTAMLGTVSPANIHLEETLATLRYACQARAIVNRVRINEDPHDRLIRQLKAEVQRLRGMRDVYEKQLGVTPRKLLDAYETPGSTAEEILSKQKEIDQLKDQLKKMEDQLFVSQNTIENDHGKLILYPEPDAENYLNGEMVRGRVQLNHGDRLCIGGNHYFKICNSQGDQDSAQMSLQPIDFEFAYQEILRIQEEKLRVELEESKQKAKKELENAKREVEMQLELQKSAYECEIKQLGSNLEQQKLELEEANKKKKELEREKELLASEIETSNKIRRLEIEDSGINISPYKSNFIQELEGLLNETTADVETALSVKTSIDAMKIGGVSPHEIQLLVREATETCRDVGVNYEFHQQQIVVDKSLQPVIRVRDRDNMLETLWQPMRFLDWIRQLRDHELEHSIKELQDAEDKWEPFDDSDIMPDSLCSSRISINMTPVKKQLNESLSQFSIDTSFLDCSVADRTNESVFLKRRDDIHQCFIQIEIASKTLKGLCHQYESREVSGKITQALDQVNSVMQDLKDLFREKSPPENSVAEIMASDVGDPENTVIENSVIDKSSTPFAVVKNFFANCNTTPSKSNLKPACPYFKNDNNTKSVKFDVE